MSLMARLFCTKHLFTNVDLCASRIIIRYAHSATKQVSRKIKFCKYEDEKGVAKLLCVILGWGGSKHKHLERYSELFHSRGFSTITVTPTLADILVFPETKGKKVSLQVLETIKQEFSECNSIFLQFSNAGCGLYHFMSQELYSFNSPFYNQVKIIGSIFDSCPIVPNEESILLAQKAFTMNVKNQLARNILWYSIGAVLPFVVWMNPTTKVFMESLRNSPISTPQLFMFSKVDVLAPYKDISDFIEYRKNRGVHTMKMLWENTPHVSHFKQDPATYKKVLKNFLDTLEI